MLKKCGSKCFLGKRGSESFPICAVRGNRISCQPNDKGLWAAYIRAREWGKSRRTYKGKARPRYRRRTYTNVARKARAMLRKRGQYVGGGGGGASRTTSKYVGRGGGGAVTVHPHIGPGFQEFGAGKGRPRAPSDFDAIVPGSGIPFSGGGGAVTVHPHIGPGFQEFGAGKGLPRAPSDFDAIVPGSGIPFSGGGGAVTVHPHVGPGFQEFGAGKGLPRAPSDFDAIVPGSGIPFS